VILLLAPVWGRLSDRIGRRRVIFLGLATAPLSYLLLAYADSLALLFAARALAGISNAVIPVIQALVADRTCDKSRVCGMANVNSAYGVAFIVGPLLGTFLLGSGGEDYRSAAFGAGGFALLSLALTARLAPGLRTPELGGLGLAALLRHHGGDASALAGGQFAWRDAGHPMLPATRMPAPSAGAATLWVTEDQPGVEALACAWLIRRFIDPEAVILPIPAAEVAGVAEKFAAVPFAMEDNGFDRMRQTFGLHGPALDRLGTLVGSAGRGDGNAMPQAPGLTAAVDGLARIHHDAADRLTASITVFDAFFGWARHQEADR
jgi:hypothetical protein